MHRFYYVIGSMNWDQVSYDKYGFLSLSNVLLSFITCNHLYQTIVFHNSCRQCRIRNPIEHASYLTNISSREGENALYRFFINCDNHEWSSIDQILTMHYSNVSEGIYSSDWRICFQWIKKVYFFLKLYYSSHERTDFKRVWFIHDYIYVSVW